MELYLIRHGQSANNALKDESERSQDPSLTEIGMQQADYIAQWFGNGENLDPYVNHATGYTEHSHSNAFGITHLYTSAMHRAMQTARPIGKALGIQPEIWVEIHEHGGIYLERDGIIEGYPGRTRAEIEAEFPEYVIPEGVNEKGWWDASRGREARHAAYGRAIMLAGELRYRAEKTPEQRIAIVTHGTFIDSLLKALTNQLPTRSMFYAHYNTAITQVDFLENNQIVFRYVNRTSHLPHALLT